MVAHHVNFFDPDQRACARRNADSLCEGDLLVGKRVSKPRDSSLASSGCAVVKSFAPEQRTCKVFWFTGPSSGRTENLALHDVQIFFDILPFGDS